MLTPAEMIASKAVATVSRNYCVEGLVLFLAFELFQVVRAESHRTLFNYDLVLRGSQYFWISEQYTVFDVAHNFRRRTQQPHAFDFGVY
jgi:hypothetical protein